MFEVGVCLYFQLGYCVERHYTEGSGQSRGRVTPKCDIAVALNGEELISD